MNKRTIPLIIMLLTLAVVHRAEAANDQPLSITVTKRTIIASGLSPGSTAVFFGIAKVPIPHAYMSHVQRWAVTVDDVGHTGTVTLDLQQDVPLTSVWAVVDLRNAHYSVMNGPGMGLREISLDNPLRKGPSQTADRFAFTHGYLDLLYVHPGTGAWTWSAVGGSTADNRGLNGSTVVSLADGKPVGQPGQKPPSFLQGGILVAVDFTRLEIAVVRLDQQLIGAAQ